MQTGEIVSARADRSQGAAVQNPAMTQTHPEAQLFIDTTSHQAVSIGLVQAAAEGGFFRS
jgi:hypothetical protein